MTEQQAAARASDSILVVGGGISGLTAAIEAAEVGYEVFIVESKPSLGGRVAQLNQYFPKLCPPTCGLEINYRRIKDNPRIHVFTLASVSKVTGNPGAYSVTVKIAPRFVNENCTCCGECAKACTMEIPNEFNFGMDTCKAAYLPNDMAFPQRFVISKKVIGTDDAKRIADACAYNAVDFDMAEKTMELSVGSIIWATGWEPYDAKKIDNLGFGRCANIVTNMMVERMAAKKGPTGGKILRPSDKAAPKTIAFVQCAGSRDQNHLEYCSYICCMASLKHVTYLRAQYPDAKVTIFYIDLRAPGYRYERFYDAIKQDENVRFVKGKVAQVDEDPATKNVTVTVEDAVAGNKIRETFDMVVLATGMQPTAAIAKPAADLKITPEGFLMNDFVKGGQFAAGCAAKPADVVSSNQSATGMALKAIQTLALR
jgi:quinone-modifying oxidoreductase subunit QmoA